LSDKYFVWQIQNLIRILEIAFLVNEINGEQFEFIKVPDEVVKRLLLFTILKS